MVIIYVKKTIIVCACLGNHREDIGCAHNITIIISKKKKKNKHQHWCVFGLTVIIFSSDSIDQANVPHHLAMSISYVENAVFALKNFGNNLQMDTFPLKLENELSFIILTVLYQLSYWARSDPDQITEPPSPLPAERMKER